jgi:hypothetical protein
MDSGTLFETAPTWSEVRATKQPEGANDVQTEHVEALWGPIDARSAIEAGAVMPTSSVLLRIRLPDTLRKAVLDQIPTSARAAAWRERLGVVPCIGRAGLCARMSDGAPLGAPSPLVLTCTH